VSGVGLPGARAVVEDMRRGLYHVVPAKIAAIRVIRLPGLEALPILDWAGAGA